LAEKRSKALTQSRSQPARLQIVLRLGRENPRWGYLRIKGELLKLSVDVSATTIATVLRQGGLGPAPRRIGPTWTQFLRLQAYGLLSPGAPSVEDEGLEELVPVPKGSLSRSTTTPPPATNLSITPRRNRTGSSSRRWAPSPIHPPRRFRHALELTLATGPRSPRESPCER